MADDKPYISLPYVEKFKPKRLDEVILDENLIAILRGSDAMLPHILILPYDPSSTPYKTFLDELYGEDQNSLNNKQ